MNALLFGLGVVAVWLAIGVAAGIVMSRRGHDFWTWFGLGAIAGPLVIRLIADTAAPDAAPAPAVADHPGEPGSGPVDVLIGIDGSEDSMRTVDEVTSLFEGRLGRVLLVSSITREAAAPDARSDARQRAEADLEAAAAHLSDAALEPARRVVVGNPAEQLVVLAETENFDVIAVGTRGRGLTRRVLGSVAEALSAQAPVPVLIASRPPTPS